MCERLESPEQWQLKLYAIFALGVSLRYFLNHLKDTTRANSTTLLTDVIILLRSDTNTNTITNVLSQSPLINYNLSPYTTAQLTVLFRDPCNALMST